MTDDIYGGVDGGTSVSTIVLLNKSGKCLAEIPGPGTNHWNIGMVKVRQVIADMVADALKAAELPPKTKLKCLCLSLSGAEEEASSEWLKSGFFDFHPGLSLDYIVCSDTRGPIATVRNSGGAVLISGTGSNALLVNPDGSEVHCGGWGAMLGDEGSAYWVSHEALKIYFDDVDKLQSVPCGYSTEVLWETIKSYFNVQTRLELLPHLYSKFNKSFFSGLCKELSIKAREGDEICKWIFNKAGKQLAQHLVAIAQGAHDGLFNVDGGLAVVCIGSVWKSWDLLKDGFASESSEIKEFTLLTLKTTAALGAAYMAANHAKNDFFKDYTANYKVFHHYKRP